VGKKMKRTLHDLQQAEENIKQKMQKIANENNLLCQQSNALREELEQTKWQIKPLLQMRNNPIAQEVLGFGTDIVNLITEYIDWEYCEICAHVMPVDGFCPCHYHRKTYDISDFVLHVLPNGYDVSFSEEEFQDIWNHIRFHKPNVIITIQMQNHNQTQFEIWDNYLTISLPYRPNR
jgi:hypothetical protein